MPFKISAKCLPYMEQEAKKKASKKRNKFQKFHTAEDVRTRVQDLPEKGTWVRASGSHLEGVEK